jgi:hypothetical protein
MKGRRLATTFGTWRGYRLTLQPSEREWDVLGTLHEVYFSALAGDTLAHLAIAALPPDALDELLPDQRSPPPPPSPRPSPARAQLTLFSTAWHS